MTLGTWKLAVALGTLVFIAPPAALAGTAQAGGQPRCQGMVATLVGTEGPDRLRGTDGRDVIVGLGGDDVIEGLAETDWICGGAGDDRLVGGPGGDLLHGNSGNDRLFGGTQARFGGDVLDGGFGNDGLVPGRDTNRRHSLDQLVWTEAERGLVVDLRKGTATGQGRDTLRVRDALRVQLTGFDDTFTGTRHRDEVSPGHGHDVLRTRGGPDEVTFPNGQDPSADPDDVVALGAGDDVLRHYDGALVVAARGGADLVIERGTGADEVRGGPGPDQLRVRLSGADGQVVRGNRGRDELTVTRRSVAGLEWDMGSGAALAGPAGTPLVLGGFESADLDPTGGSVTVTGTARGDSLDSSAPTWFEGLGGRDRFIGSAAEDTFDGGPGRDTYDSDRGGPPNTCRSVESDPTSACTSARP